MLAARVEPKNGPQERKKTDNFKPLRFARDRGGIAGVAQRKPPGAPNREESGSKGSQGIITDGPGINHSLQGRRRRAGVIRRPSQSRYSMHRQTRPYSRPTAKQEFTACCAMDPPTGERKCEVTFVAEASAQAMVREQKVISSAGAWAMVDACTAWAERNSSAGMLVTGGGLVFTGKLTGEFLALDEDTGKMLWQFQTSSSINSTAITYMYMHKGLQYVTIASGLGGPLARRAVGNKVPTGGSLWTFAIMPEFLRSELQSPFVRQAGRGS
jgi:hypothetical protein